MAALIVLTNFPDRKTARQISTALVKEGLAVCCTLVPGAESIYQWKGELQNDPEVYAVIKTVEEKYEALELSLRRKHPYDVPEILAMKTHNGSPAYFDWMNAVLTPGAEPVETPVEATTPEQEAEQAAIEALVRRAEEE